MMARAVGVRPDIVNVPVDIARSPAHAARALGRRARRRHRCSRIDKALAELDWRPQYGLEDGYRQSYEWFAAGGRDRYEFDFSADDAVLARVSRAAGAG